MCESLLKNKIPFYSTMDEDDEDDFFDAEEELRIYGIV